MDKPSSYNDYLIREEDLIRNDLSDYLKKHEQKEMLRFLVAGSVDDGKSTLIGRLLYDSHLIYQDHLSAVYHDSETYNTTPNEIDLSLLTDGLKAEREQGITIDVAYRYFSTEKRSFIICDAPGHEQYTRNMATGASHCDLALILVDATRGIQDQTRRHSLIASLMGVQQIAVIVNKMDLVGYDETVFRSICTQYQAFSGKLKIKSLSFIPLSALNGDNVVERSMRMTWYQGSTLLAFLEGLPLVNDRNLTDFRFPVQLAVRPHAGFRGYAGSIVSGIIRKGDAITVLPSGKQTYVKSIETYEGALDEAFAPMPVIITTTDEVDISRGDMLAKVNNIPRRNTRFEAMLVWMDDTRPLQAGDRYLLKSTTQTIPASITTIRYRFDLNNLIRQETPVLSLNDIGRVTITTTKPLLYDPFARNKKTGSFILIDRISNQTCAGGIILEQEVSDFLGESPISGDKPATLWMTGLSGAGKSTIAQVLKRRLDEKGFNTYVLDGDELRKGLNNNLGFSPEDRQENVRRVAEVARILNNAGVTVIVALISPYKADRQMAAGIIGDNFIEVYINTSIETCRQRDPKGLYKKVARGEITAFTGVDAPYEKPDSPDLIIDTQGRSVEDSVRDILNYLFK